MTREQMIDEAVRGAPRVLEYARAKLKRWDRDMSRSWIGHSIADVGIRNYLGYGSIEKIRAEFRRIQEREGLCQMAKAYNIEHRAH